MEKNKQKPFEYIKFIKYENPDMMMVEIMSKLTGIEIYNTPFYFSNIFILNGMIMDKLN